MRAIYTAIMFCFVALVAVHAEARGFHRGGGEAPAPHVDLNAPLPTDVHDGLDEVNATRRQNGLVPFLRDNRLTDAAKRIAHYRAANHIGGHCGDFNFLAPNSGCSTAGCGVTDSGWATCCTYEHWKYAGAAWCRGKDGQRYCDLFVR